MAIELHLRLRWYAGGADGDIAGLIELVLQMADQAAFGDADLRLDDIHAGDQLGHGVLDLDTRVDLDEVELAAVRIHQELDRAGVGVADRAHQAQRGIAQRLARGAVEVGRGRAFDHFLVAPLHGAVALEQVHHITGGVAQNLHFHMARAAHQFSK